MVEGNPSEKDQADTEKKPSAGALAPGNKEPLVTTNGREANRNDKKRDTYDWITLIIAVTGLCGVWYYAYWATVQATGTTAAANAAKQSADAAKESADAAVAASRAWIIPADSLTHEAKNSHDKTIELRWINVGKTVAMDIRETSEHVIQRYPSRPPKFRSGCPEPGDAGMDIIAYVLPDHPFARTFPLPDENEDELFIHGCIKYRDVLSNQTRVTEFCYDIFRPPGRVRPPGMDQFLVGPATISCPALGFSGIQIR